MVRAIDGAGVGCGRAVGGSTGSLPAAAACVELVYGGGRRTDGDVDASDADAGVSTREDDDGADDEAGGMAGVVASGAVDDGAVAAPRDARIGDGAELGGDVLSGVALGGAPAGSVPRADPVADDGAGGGSAAPAAAVPRAAGIGVVWRDAFAAVLVAGRAGGGPDGASSAMITDRPTKPITTARMP